MTMGTLLRVAYYFRKMSRAFVSDKEDWEYCAKAGQRCLHAQPGRECSVVECPHFIKTEKAPDRTGPGLKVVARRRPERAGNDPAGKGTQAGARGGKLTGNDRAGKNPQAGARGGKLTGNDRAGKNSASGTPGNKRATKRSTVKIPKRWGGRSGER